MIRIRSPRIAWTTNNTFAKEDMPMITNLSGSYRSGASIA